jgi:hypothetical protein
VCRKEVVIPGLLVWAEPEIQHVVMVPGLLDSGFRFAAPE